MKIKLSPVCMNGHLIATVTGDVISLNGVEFDFGQLLDGSTIPSGAISSHWITGDVERINGEIHLTLVLPHRHDANHETRFPEHYDKYIRVIDGVVPMPYFIITEE